MARKNTTKPTDSAPVTAPVVETAPVTAPVVETASTFVDKAPKAVSYTHLRAHET